MLIPRGRRIGTWGQRHSWVRYFWITFCRCALRDNKENRVLCLFDLVEKPNLIWFFWIPRIEDAAGAVRRALWWIVHRRGEWPIWQSCGQCDSCVLFWSCQWFRKVPAKKIKNICQTLQPHGVYFYLVIVLLGITVQNHGGQGAHALILRRIFPTLPTYALDLAYNIFRPMSVLCRMLSARACATKQDTWRVEGDKRNKYHNYFWSHFAKNIAVTSLVHPFKTWISCLENKYPCNANVCHGYRYHRDSACQYNWWYRSNGIFKVKREANIPSARMRVMVMKIVMVARVSVQLVIS